MATLEQLCAIDRAIQTARQQRGRDGVVEALELVRCALTDATGCTCPTGMGATGATGPCCTGITGPTGIGPGEMLNFGDRSPAVRVIGGTPFWVDGFLDPGWGDFAGDADDPTDRPWILISRPGLMVTLCALQIASSFPTVPISVEYSIRRVRAGVGVVIVPTVTLVYAGPGTQSDCVDISAFVQPGDQVQIRTVINGGEPTPVAGTLQVSATITTQ